MRHLVFASGVGLVGLALSGCHKSDPQGSSSRGGPAPSTASSGGEARRSSAEAIPSASSSPSGARSVFAPSPAKSMQRAPKVLGVALGTSRARLEERLGPCEALEAGGCIYWSRGVEFELAGDDVQRAIAHAAADRSSLRSAAEPGKHEFLAFRDEVAGARIGLTTQALHDLLGEPTQRLRAVPNGADPAGEATVYEYASLGLALELAGDPLRVVRIHTPIAPARATKQTP